jgi:glycosyltransferase involved in cell wall biosynthesis
MKISVAMTTYNGEQFLDEQLDSIFAQSRLPDELVICDDGSSDGTSQILREYAARAPFDLRIIVNDERLGSTQNFEKAVDLCSGDVIALCDQDDVWRPQKLAVLETAFASDPELGLAFSNADLLDDNGAPLRGDLWSRCTLNKRRRRGLGGSRRYDLLLGYPFTTGATMAFRSSFKPLLLPFPTDAPTFIHDRWITLVIAAVARIAMIEERLIAYRVHRQQQLGLGKMPLALKVFVPHRCWSDANGLAALEERLRGNPAYPTNPEFRRSLANRRDHIAARSKFSRNPLRRVKQVATEFWSGRYVRFPHGRVVWLQDLLVGTATNPASGAAPDQR